MRRVALATRSPPLPVRRKVLQALLPTRRPRQEQIYAAVNSAGPAAQFQRQSTVPIRQWSSTPPLPSSSNLVHNCYCHVKNCGTHSFSPATADNGLFQVPPGEDSVTANPETRIWFNPPKFWAATNHMRKEEADELLSRVLRLAENSELDHLRQYSFISVGWPRAPKERQPH